MDEACVAGTAKYRKGRRLAGEVQDECEDEEIPDWSSDNEDVDEGISDSYLVELELDNPAWKWVVGIYQGPGRARFVRIPNKSTKFLMAVITKYCEEESVICTYGSK